MYLNHINPHNSFLRLTVEGDLSKEGSSKQPQNLPQSCLVTSFARHPICLTKPHGVSQRKANGVCLNDKYKSAASRTDSLMVKNLEAAVTCARTKAAIR